MRAELTRPPGSLQENSCLTSIVTVESWAFLKGAFSSRRLQASGLGGPAGGVSPKTRHRFVPPETITSGQGKTGRMQFSLGGACAVACRNGAAGMRRAVLLVLRGIYTDTQKGRAAVPCFTRRGKRVTVENGLDSFKLIDNASASSLGRFRRRLTAEFLVVTRTGCRLMAIIYRI